MRVIPLLFIALGRSVLFVGEKKISYIHVEVSSLGGDAASGSDCWTRLQEYFFFFLDASILKGQRSRIAKRAANQPNLCCSPPLMPHLP